MDSSMMVLSVVIMSALRGSIPLIFSSLGGLLSERTGTIQIALEGFMLAGALAASISGYLFHSSWIGLFAACIAGSFLSLTMAFFVIRLKMDHVVTGTAFNIFVVGLAPLITKLMFDSTGSTPGLLLEDRFTWEPFAVLTLIVLAFCYMYYFTHLGLWIRFCGELPEALTSAGISVVRTRWFGIIGAGFLAGMGGGFLSLYLSSAYSPMMTAGRGFISLAALIFGRWQPVPTILVCLGFSLFDSLANILQGQTQIPVQFIQVLPYLLTIIALCGVLGQSRAPKFLGRIQ